MKNLVATTNNDDKDKEPSTRRHTPGGEDFDTNVVFVYECRHCSGGASIAYFVNNSIDCWISWKIDESEQDYDMMPGVTTNMTTPGQDQDHMGRVARSAYLMVKGSVAEDLVTREELLEALQCAGEW